MSFERNVFMYSNSFSFKCIQSIPFNNEYCKQLFVVMLHNISTLCLSHFLTLSCQPKYSGVQKDDLSEGCFLLLLKLIKTKDNPK